MERYLGYVLLVFMACIFNASCSRRDDVGTNEIVEVNGKWTWVSGAVTSNPAGTNYGMKGYSSVANLPSGRDGAVASVNKDGQLLLFGGMGFDSTGGGGTLNDLWKFDGENWTWLSGSNIAGQKGTYGIKGIPEGQNVPGARVGAVSWTDNTGSLWLFGGSGYDSQGMAGYLNDLWKFDGNNWSWMTGSSDVGQAGSKSIPASSNVPGARYGAVSSADKRGNLWLFGGRGLDSLGTDCSLNDLWKFDGANWVWISGSKIACQSGTYGTKNISEESSMPGARVESVSWIDNCDNFWIYGGYGIDSTGRGGILNDLWKFDGSTWTWISGDKIANKGGVYGTKGYPAVTNIPGARAVANTWIDTSGSLWLFGGDGYDSTGIEGVLDDLWKFDGNNWIWVSGSNIVNQGGSFGMKGAPLATNVPGARHSAVSWVDSLGKLWLFGGTGYDSFSKYGTLNDLLQFQLCGKAGGFITCE